MSVSSENHGTKGPRQWDNYSLGQLCHSWRDTIRNSCQLHINSDLSNTRRKTNGRRWNSSLGFHIKIIPNYIVFIEKKIDSNVTSQRTKINQQDRFIKIKQILHTSYQWRIYKLMAYTSFDKLWQVFSIFLFNFKVCCLIKINNNYVN